MCVGSLGEHSRSDKGGGVCPECRQGPPEYPMERLDLEGERERRRKRAGKQGVGDEEHERKRNAEAKLPYRHRSAYEG